MLGLERTISSPPVDVVKALSDLKVTPGMERIHMSTNTNTANTNPFAQRGIISYPLHYDKQFVVAF